MIGSRAAPARKRASLLLDLAPHGGYLAKGIAAFAGGLLLHRFTLTDRIERRFVFCGPVPSTYVLPGVTRHGALWCADFPQASFARVHPANLILLNTLILYD